MRLLTSGIVIIAIAIAIAIGAVGGGLYLVRQQVASPLPIEEPVLFTVKRGQSGMSVIRALRADHNHDVAPLAVKVWLKLMAPEAGPKAGTYQLQPGMSLAEAYAHLSNGEEYQFAISLIEGHTLQQWLAVLENHEYVDFDVSETTRAALLEAWPHDALGQASRLEGLLLADTYYFTATTPASVLLKRALDAMAAYLSSAWDERDPALPLSSAYEGLILASIIEKETGVPEERPRIAGVFVNRLERGMRLQTDPTVIYGIGAEFDGNITRAHLRQKTPYNTYVIKGLPPTPIAMSGKAAIQAALHPMTTDALYFVSRGDGTHQFSSTLEDHNKAVYQYQIKQQGKK
ncbi:endolytic transglycosylase MltG [Alteromonas sp. ASW11-19]|uniref:Endolytic murein transglycosylase n=1 Tax=Alteromonas salexigens TaxID=2982530 RepID=A0ABT2VKY6_9ALTE|nr:endolytic transglycosylase MltG [Alteromonas salexigens]MCU7553966.1 endolytic transglycosylase MltG [Alteromonas salexigens]